MDLIHFVSQNTALFDKGHKNDTVNDFKDNVWKKRIEEKLGNEEEKSDWYIIHGL